MNKKLKLKKTTVTNLTDDQMKKVRGASIYLHTCDCQDTESCSVAYKCCPPPEEVAAKDMEKIGG